MTSSEARSSHRGPLVAPLRADPPGTRRVMRAPLRVLHVVGGMDHGGVETWLMHVLRRLDRQKVCMDFLVHADGLRAFDEEIIARGARILRCPLPAPPWRYAMSLRSTLRRAGPFDVVHSHVHHFSGFVLNVARLAGVPVCVAHSHNDCRVAEASAGLRRSFYLAATQQAVLHVQSAGLACSRDAASDLYGPGWTRDPRVQVLHYGIDFEPFRQPVDRAAVRGELGLGPGRVFGHVGRFSEQKDHARLLEIFAVLARTDAEAQLLLVGDGPLRPTIESRVHYLGLSERVFFPGVRSDVPRVLRAMDAFVFPSLYEGLPVAVLEAQAAGLPILMSTAVSDEVVAVPQLVTRIERARPPAEWAAIALDLAASPTVPPESALAAVAASGFDINTSAERLEALYVELVERASARPRRWPANILRHRVRRLTSGCGIPSHDGDPCR